MAHRLYRDSDGDVDNGRLVGLGSGANYEDWHNGPECMDCGMKRCLHCSPEWWLGNCSAVPPVPTKITFEQELLAWLQHRRAAAMAEGDSLGAFDERAIEAWAASFTFEEVIDWIGDHGET